MRQRGHLDVEGGREGSQDGEREEGGRHQTRKSPLVGASSHSWILQRVSFSNVSLARRTFPNLRGYQKSGRLREINESFFPVLHVYSLSLSLKTFTLLGFLDMKLVGFESHRHWQTNGV